MDLRLSPSGHLMLPITPLSRGTDRQQETFKLLAMNVPILTGHGVEDATGQHLHIVESEFVRGGYRSAELFNPRHAAPPGAVETGDTDDEGIKQPWELLNMTSSPSSAAAEQPRSERGSPLKLIGRLSAPRRRSVCR